MKSKTIYSMFFWVMIYCILADTIGLFIPVYFTNPDISNYLYEFIFTLLLITVPIFSYRAMYLPQDANWKTALTISIITTSLAFIFFGFITALKIWPTESYDTVIYVKKGSPKVKIISHYFNLGATGDGKKVVLRREITPFLKIETLIDTNLVDKNEWIRQHR